MVGEKFQFTDEKYPIHDLLFPEHLAKIPDILRKGNPEYNEETLDLELWYQGYCMALSPDMDVTLWIPLEGEEDKFIPCMVVQEELKQEYTAKILLRF